MRAFPPTPEDTSFLSVGEAVEEVRLCWWVCCLLQTRSVVNLFMDGNVHYKRGEDWEGEKDS